MASGLGRRTAVGILVAGALVVACGANGTGKGIVSTGDFPYDLAVSSGDIWVVNYNSSTLQRIDHRTEQITSTIAVGHHPDGVIAAGGMLWVTSTADGAVYRIDPAREAVTLRVRVPAEVANPRPEPADVWMGGLPLNFVTALDPGTGRFTARIPLHGAGWLTVADGSVWVGSILDRTVDRIDPTNGRITASIPLPTSPWRFASTPGAIWVNSYRSGRIYRIDPAANRVAFSVVLGDHSAGIAIGPDGRVWATSHVGGNLPSALSPIDPSPAHSYVLGIDPVTDRVVSRIDTAAGFYGPIVIADGSVWVLDPGGSHLAMYPLPRRRPLTVTSPTGATRTAGRRARWSR